MGVLGAQWWFMSGDLKVKVCQEWGVLLGGSWRTLMVPDRILEWQGHLWCQRLPFLTPRKIPRKFFLISLLEVCQEWGVLRGSTWRTLRVPDRILGWQNHLWCHGLPYLTTRKIPWKFCVNIFIISVSRRGVLHEGTWRTLRVPDRRHGWQGHPWCNGWSCLTRR